MIAHTIQSLGCIICCTDEIEHAVERSQISDNSFACGKARRIERVSHLLKDIRNARFRELVPRTCLVSGTERDSGQTLSIGFAGTLRIVDFCARHIFANESFKRLPAARASNADILVSDHPFGFPVQRTKAGIRVPAWVRQQLPITSEWTDTLSQLAPSLLKEIRRYLRRYGYTIEMSTGRAAALSYYRDLHVPYLKTRFGESTILASESAFVDQCHHMTRLDLLCNGAIVAASLLECRDTRLMIRASSMCPAVKGLTGRADTLDYFSLLIGQLLACDYLDFGLSRPHLDNGSFRYKAKWCSLLSPTGGVKADIRILVQRKTEATLAFLQRNHFLQCDGNDLFLRILGNPEDPESHMEQRAQVAGVSAVYRTDDLTRAGMVLG